MARVLIVIVNYRTAVLVVDCLRSLELVRQDADVQVAVVDNLSGDDSLSVLSNAIESDRWRDWVRLLPAPKNGGFAYGNNFAVEPALKSDSPPDFIWLLNPDTIVRTGSLRALIDFLEANTHVGIVGSRLELPNGQLPTIAFRFFSILSELDRGLSFGPVSRLLKRYRVVLDQPTSDAEVDWVPGASMLIRRDVFERIGLLDDGYFMYFEETDFCLRARRADIGCGVAIASHVVHLEGQSSGIRQSDARPKRLPQFWFDSRQRYFRKNYGRVYALCVDFVWSIGYGLRRIRYLIQGKRELDPPYLFRDTLASTFRNSDITR